MHPSNGKYCNGLLWVLNSFLTTISWILQSHSQAAEHAAIDSCGKEFFADNDFLLAYFSHNHKQQNILQGIYSFG